MLGKTEAYVGAETPKAEALADISQDRFPLTQKVGSGSFTEIRWTAGTGLCQRSFARLWAVA
jgi:hypothetical protein